MGAQAGGPPRQQERRPLALFGARERDRHRGPLQRRRSAVGRHAPEAGAELCDIPPVVSSNDLTIPLDYNTRATDEMTPTA